MAKVMFSSLSVVLVCLSVCLSVSNITENCWTDFHEIFRIAGTWCREQLGTFSGCSIQPLDHRTFSSTFSKESMPLSSIAEKRLNGFSWNFQRRADLAQGAIWNIFGMLRLTPWMLSRFVYFLGPCLFVISWKNGWTDFHDFFMKFHARRKK